MKTNGRKFLNFFVIAIIAGFVLSSCNKDDEVTPDTMSMNDIVALAQETSDLSTLVTALTTAELVTTLQGAGPFTVFAPTNAAFNKLDDGVLDILLDNPSVLAEVLKYHVVSGEVMSTDLTNGPVQTLLSGKTISVTVGSSVILNGTSNVVTADIEAENGVVHLIDEVLLPEGFELPKSSIVSIASETASLSILVDALTMFPDLVDALSMEGNYTVFAPTNAAFTELLGVIGQSDLEDVPEDVIERLLKYHVISSAALMSTDLEDGQMAATLLSTDDKIEVLIDGSVVMINDAKVTTPNIEASNGVIHIVDAVLVPELELSIVNTIVEPAYFNKDFSILTAAVVKAELLTTLIDPQANFTLFAPNNDAFEEAGITSLEGLTAEDLAPILTYHVINDEVFGDGLPATGSAVPTLGGDFYLSINDNGAYINGLTMVTAATLSGGALDYDNGVVHLIDRTLVPASKNIVEIAVAASQASDAEFGQLVAALTAVENDETTDALVTILSGEGSYTVFAPTDAAFQSLYTLAQVADFDALVAAVGIGTIEVVLKYHVLGSRVFSTDIPNALDGNSSVNLSPLAEGLFTLNSDFTIEDQDFVLELGTVDATIIDTDILSTNGVIHVIDEVILP